MNKRSVIWKTPYLVYSAQFRVLQQMKYTKTSILDPSNLSQTPILESFLERPTFYYIETVKFRLFQQFPNPYFILAFFQV